MPMSRRVSISCVLAACLAAVCASAGVVVEVEQRLPVRVRRLSVREYVRSVRALVGVELSVHRFMADSLDTEFDNGQPGAGGGGATDLRVGGTRIAVAGGGGTRPPLAGWWTRHTSSRQWVQNRSIAPGQSSAARACGSA